jgi:hypothetical protein
VLKFNDGEKLLIKYVYIGLSINVSTVVVAIRLITSIIHYISSLLNFYINIHTSNT